jgi:hypothetical protein
MELNLDMWLPSCGGVIVFNVNRVTVLIRWFLWPLYLKHQEEEEEERLEPIHGPINAAN